MLLGMCGVCKREITFHEEKAQEFIKCKKCGEKHYIGKREGSLSTIHCGCGDIIYEEGGGLWHDHLNKER
jgi:DNA-directed RNA polymerase subunit RPC12/RpoP